MKVLLPVLLIAAALASPAHAACTAPTNEVKIPNGSTATMEEMLAAKKAIQDNNAVVETYTQCLKAEQEAKIAAGGPDMKDEAKVKISTARAAIAGRISGSTMWRKIFHSLTPSTRALSISAKGRALMKFRMNRVQKPVWKATWNSTRPVMVS